MQHPVRGNDDSDMMSAFSVGKAIPLATASSDSEPSVPPMGAVYPRDPETSGIGNQFMKETIVKVLENSRICPSFGLVPQDASSSRGTQK